MEFSQLTEILDLSEGSVTLHGAYQHEIAIAALRRVSGGEGLAETLQAGMDYHDKTSWGDNETEHEALFFGDAADHFFDRLLKGLDLILHDMSADPLELVAADEFMNKLAGK